MLDVVGLSKRYATNLVLNGVSLSVRPGELVVLMGPSGAGKTTLFRCIGRLIEPDAGRVRLRGMDITHLRGRALRRARRDVAVIFQQFNLVRRASVQSNVLSGMLAHLPAWRVATRLWPADAIARADACLARVGLDGMAPRRADRLSGGQQQRVAIARALAQQSAVILADEPVASLDAENAMRVLDLLQSLTREKGLAVLCSLHDGRLAEAYADRILYMREGRIEVAGAVAARTGTERSRSLHLLQERERPGATAT